MRAIDLQRAAAKAIIPGATPMILEDTGKRMVTTCARVGATGLVATAYRAGCWKRDLGEQHPQYTDYYNTVEGAILAMHHDCALRVEALKYLHGERIFKLDDFKRLALKEDFTLLLVPSDQRVTFYDAMLLIDNNSNILSADQLCLERQERFIAFGAPRNAPVTDIDNVAFLGNPLKKIMANSLVIMRHIDLGQWQQAYYRFAGLCVYAQTHDQEMTARNVKLTTLQQFYLQLRQLPDNPQKFCNELLTQLAEPQQRKRKLLLDIDEDASKFNIDEMNAAMQTLYEQLASKDAKIALDNVMAGLSNAHLGEAYDDSEEEEGQ